MQLTLGVCDLPVPHEVAVDQAPQAHGAGVVVGNIIAQQVAGLHANNRALDHAHVVFANAAGVRNGRQQGESVVGIAESLYACRVSEGGNNVLGDNAEAAVSVGEGAVNLPETGSTVIGRSF